MLSETLRVRFAKKGRLKFISHLDLCRTMQSAMLRAKIPLWYTKGFNPHPRLSIALPLSVGCESGCELLDVKVTEITDPAEIIKTLNAATAPGLDIIEAYKPETKFNEIGYAEYQLSLSLPHCSKDEIETLFSASVLVPKRTKKGCVNTDIVPMIRSIVFETRENGVICRAVLSASPDSYLNPEYIVRAIELNRGLAENSFDYNICRTNILNKSGDIFR